MDDDDDLSGGDTWHPDLDGDSFGDEDRSTTACEQPDGYVANDYDCDDGDAAVNPLADEVCDDVDNDCDGDTDGKDDSLTGGLLRYADDDGDGYGDPDAAKAMCSERSGYVEDASDCDDTDETVNPLGTEVCDGADNDCDGATDHDDDSLDDGWRHADTDGDGYGDPDAMVASCVELSGYVDDDTDCDDTDETVNAEGTEALNGKDDDCDGLVDVASADVAGALLVGESAGDQAGFALAPAGDVDDDGYDDLVIGAWGNDAAGSAAGAAYFVSGPLAGTVDLSAATATFTGEAASDEAGYAVAGGADLDLDGRADLLVGAWGLDDAGTDAGAAYLLLGADAKGTTSLADAHAVLLGVGTRDYAGKAVAFVGETDILVGAPGEDTGGSQAGVAYHLAGPVTGTQSLADPHALWGETSADEAGTTVAGAGDVSGDGIDDLFVGAPGQDGGGSGSGAIYVIHGPIASDLDLSAADAVWVGAAGDGAGAALAAAGDVDDDGYDDGLFGVALADDGGSASGAAYLILGPLATDKALADADIVMSGVSAGDGAGSAVAGGDDVNDDGTLDLLVGAPDADDGASDAGVVYLVLGMPSASLVLDEAHALILGSTADDALGGAVALPGDVDGDGYGDLLCGAWGADDGGSASGAAYLFFGTGW